MKVTVHLFASLTDLFGDTKIVVNIDGEPTISALRSQICENYSNAVSALAACRFAVNHEFVENETLAIDADSEIALIPPVSGG